MNPDTQNSVQGKAICQMGINRFSGNPFQHCLLYRQYTSFHKLLHFHFWHSILSPNGCSTFCSSPLNFSSCFPSLKFSVFKPLFRHKVLIIDECSRQVKENQVDSNLKGERRRMRKTFQELLGNCFCHFTLIVSVNLHATSLVFPCQFSIDR